MFELLEVVQGETVGKISLDLFWCLQREIAIVQRCYRLIDRDWKRESVVISVIIFYAVYTKNSPYFLTPITLI